MKNILMIAIMSLVLTDMMVAQDGQKTSFGILGGVNFANITGNNFNGDEISSSGIIGFHAGLRAMIPVASEFYFQPGVLFTTKGSEFTQGIGTQTLNLSYIEVPLNLVYKSRLGGGSFYLGFGPYVGYGIMGSSTIKSSLGSVESDVKFQSEVTSADPITTTYIKPLDVGGNVFVGYELSGGLFLQLNTQLGLVNINPNDSRVPNDETSLKNVGFGLSLGYGF